MLLSRREIPILTTNLIYLPAFALVALRRSNYEFVLYVGIIVVVGAWILVKQRTVRFDTTILWGLTVWGFLHMCGGNVRVGGDVLYGLELAPIVPRFHILRYDQVVHAFGFGVATLVCHHLLRPYLREGINRKRALAILVALMGLGVGAVNEIVEFIAVLSIPETGVGGYENTMFDLVFDALGAVVAVTWLAATGKLRTR